MGSTESMCPGCDHPRHLGEACGDRVRHAYQVPTKEIVSTFADGFGIWHARITFPGVGYGPDHLDANIDRIRAKARRAIRRAIAARQGDQRFTVRVHVVANDLDSMNIMRSITYAERTDAR